MYIALKNFSGLVSMVCGEVKDLKGVRKTTIESLLKAGYIKEVKKDTRQNQEIIEENKKLNQEKEELLKKIEELEIKMSNLEQGEKEIEEVSKDKQKEIEEISEK